MSDKKTSSNPLTRLFRGPKPPPAKEVETNGVSKHKSIPKSLRSVVTSSGEHSWAKTIKKITPAIVALTVNRARHFEGSAGSMHGTGFVVDKKRGLILTNRHVVTLGPVSAEAQFYNMEIVTVQPVYRDPVHDFAFFKFNPKDLEFAELEEIKLAPQEGKVGTEIRVVGNDNGEQLTILSGTISRTDREAPSYDINTFYMTSASSTSGGSSGSPVLNIKGNAVALNSGGLSSGGATSFFLPLDRCLRALQLMQNTKPGTPYEVPRGTLQCVFRHVPFEELRRLGLPKAEEGLVRKADKDAKGMLIVAVVAPESPAHKLGVQSGDVLLRINDKRIAKFLPLAELLDDCAKQAFYGPKADRKIQKVTLQVQRGNETKEFQITVSDLHSLLPTEFLEVSHAVIHPMSYAYSIAFFIPLPQLLVAFPGYMLDKEDVGSLSVIVAINDEPTPDLDTLERVLAPIPDGKKILVRYFHVQDKHRTQLASITVDRRWFPMRRARRNPVNGLFEFSECQEPAAEQAPVEVQVASFVTPHALLLKNEKQSEDDDLSDQEDEADEAGSLTEKEKLMLQSVSKSLVWVEFSVPVPADGRPNENYAGCGIIVSHEEGIVLVDQNTVISTLGDAEITIAESVVIKATPVFVHPVYNYAFIKYDPSQLGNTDLTSVKFSKKPLRIGDKVLYAGLSGSKQFSHVKTKLQSIDRLNISESMSAPSFSCKNQEIYSFDKPFVRSVGGIVLDKHGKIQGIHSSFAVRGSEFMATAMPVGIHSVLKQLKSGHRSITVPFLGVSFASMSMSVATKMGLTSEWFNKLDNAKDSRGERMCLTVKVSLAGSSASQVLENGDIILSIDDRPVVTPTGADSITLELHEQYLHSQKRSSKRHSKRSSKSRKSSGSQPLHSLRVVRNMEEIEVKVQPLELGSLGTTHVVEFAGLITQPPPLAVSWLGFLPDDVAKEDLGVYTSGFFFGSPAERYNAPNCTWVRTVNGKPCRNIEEFKDCVRVVGHNEDVRVEVMLLTGRVEVFTLKTDLHYWKTSELKRDKKSGLWRRTTIEHIKSK